MRYYEREHLDGYARIRSQGLDQWSDLHEERGGFGDFPNRRFLEQVLPDVTGGPPLRVLEYGCGTGPAACFLAARGYRVRGIDLVPDAVEVARGRAARLGLTVDFAVEDVCAWGDAREQYDVVLDSFCLQSIVLDHDRARVLDGVRRRLVPGGRFVLSTAVFDPVRDYGRARFDRATGIVWTPASEPGEGAVLVDGDWYLPNRRHRTPESLRAELLGFGFAVTYQSANGGDVVCVADDPIACASRARDGAGGRRRGDA